MDNNSDQRKVGNIWLVWLVSLIATCAVFYGMDLLVMSMQGLPLNWDLTPVQ